MITPGPQNPLRDRADHRLQRVPDPCVLVVFGVTGDLARKKLIPAVYDLANRGLLPPGFAMLGFARRDWDAGEMARFFEEATASGHLAMVSAGAPQRPEDVADVVRFVVTRPPGQMIDLIHARSHSAVDPANMVEQMLDRP